MIDPTDDIAGTRRAIERTASKFNIYFLTGLAVLGGVLAIVGGASGGLDALFSARPADQSAAQVVIGVVTFTLFFPFAMTLYFARHLLLSIKRLEARLDGRYANGR